MTNPTSSQDIFGDENSPLVPTLETGKDLIDSILVYAQDDLFGYPNEFNQAQTHDANTTLNLLDSPPILKNSAHIGNYLSFAEMGTEVVEIIREAQVQIINLPNQAIWAYRLVGLDELKPTLTFKGKIDSATLEAIFIPDEFEVDAQTLLEISMMSVSGPTITWTEGLKRTLKESISIHSGKYISRLNSDDVIEFAYKYPYRMRFIDHNQVHSMKFRRFGPYEKDGAYYNVFSRVADISEEPKAEKKSKNNQAKSSFGFQGNSPSLLLA